MCISVENGGLFHSLLCLVNDHLNVQQPVCFVHDHEQFIVVIFFLFHSHPDKGRDRSIGLLPWSYFFLSGLRYSTIAFLALSASPKST